MLNFRRLWLATGLGLVMIFLTIRSSQAAGRQLMHGHVPRAVSNLQPIGFFPGTNHLNLAIGLPLRNEAALDQMIQQLYDPASPNFHQFLTPSQFAENFGPTEADYQAVIDFAKANGLTVTGRHPNRALLDVSGSVSDIQRIFHVTMRVYQHPKENRKFYAPDTEPSVDLAVPVLHISGLDNYSLLRPANLAIKPGNGSTPTNLIPNLGSGPGGLYAGNDFRAAYVPGVSLNGSGQILALVEFDGYYTNDIRQYELAYNFPNITLTNVLLDGFGGTAGSANMEVALDIDMAMAMATNLTKVVVYEAPNNTAYVNDILSRMATDLPLAKQLSSSWAGPNPGTNAGSDVFFKQFAAQGQSYFQASGDTGAYSGGVPSPDDDSYVTVVGGTTLSTTVGGGSWTAETAWNGYNSGNSTEGSSGGISTIYPIPSWQTNINMSSNHGSTTFRNIPDVAMTADNIFIYYNNGQPHMIGGTSAAAPLWAGFTALVNQQALAKGRSTVGFINPAIYAIGRGGNYGACFHDITTGNNTNLVSPANFPAVAGYDLCTGWGTPNGINLINALATPDSLGIFPGTGFTAFGPVGGPFNATVQSFILTNSAGTPVTWALTSVPNWLKVSSVGGALTASGSTTVTVTLNASGNNLFAGAYVTNLIFTNLTTGIAQIRQFVLQLGQPLDQNSGFESGDFSWWNLAGDGVIDGLIYNSVETNSDGVHSGVYGALLGESGQLAYLSQNLPTLPGQNYLLSFWLNNFGGHTPNQFQVNWNTNATGTNTLFNQSNIAAINNWTNMQFIVTATATNTTLQFGARNDNYYFGLDDVSIQPIPNPAFRSLARTSNNTVALTWNSLAGIAYQVQCSTNLATTNWINLSTNTAADYTLTMTNSITTAPQKFYRIRQLP